MSDANVEKAVALFSPGWPPGRVANGIVTYVGQISDGLARKNHRAYVIAPHAAAGATDLPALSLSDVREPQLQQLAQRALTRIPQVEPIGATLGIQLAAGVRQLCQQHDIGLLELEESFGASWFLQQLIDVPVVVRLHGPWFLNGIALGVAQDAAFARRNAAERRGMRSADGLTAPSRDVLEAVRRTHGIQLSHAAVIANPAPVVAAERRWTPATSDQQSILFVGRFDRHKGGDIVIDAFAQIAAACPTARLIFVGPDRGFTTAAGQLFDLPGYVRARLPEATAALVDVRGPLSAVQIEPLRRSACVTIIASRYENFGLALVEALAFGCPTVASNTGGNPEILTDGKTGLLVRPNDPADLARAVIELFNDPTRAAAFGQAGAVDLAARLAPDRIASETWDYYRSVWDRLAHQKRRRPLRWLLPLLRAV